MPSPGISAPIDFSKTIDKSRLKDKTALVTGGASGIGAGVVSELAQAGAYVTILDLNDEAGENYTRDLTAKGLKYADHRDVRSHCSNGDRRVHFAQANVADWQSQLEAFKKCIHFSPNKTIDIVIAAAGLNGYSFFQDHPFLQEDEDGDPLPSKWNVIEVNLTGAYYTTCLAVHYFRQTAKSEEDFLKAEKQLILVASNIAYNPVPLFSNYAASKAGVRALWVSLRGHPHLTGMRTNLLAPHIVKTPMTKDYQSILAEQGLKMVELQEVLDVLLRMLCDDSIRGRAVAVNPGHPYDLCDELEVSHLCCSITILSDRELTSA